MVTSAPQVQNEVSPQTVCGDLVRMMPALAASREALLELTSHIPIPHFLAAQQLFEALLRVCKSVPWLEESAQTEWLSRPVLAAWIAAIAADTAARDAAFQDAQSRGLPIPRHEHPYQGDSHLEHLRQSYPVLSSLLDPQAAPPKGVEQFRAALLLCIYRWGPDRHIVARDALAFSIRGARRRPSSDLGQFLPSLGDARTIEDFLTAATQLPDGASIELREAWATIGEALRGDNGSKRQHPRPIGAPPEAPTIEGDEPDPGAGNDEPAEPSLLSGGIRPASPDKTRGEPADDDSGESRFVALAYEGKGFGDVREAAFRATQATWRKNQHLLTEHFEALSVAEARFLGRHLMVDIGRGLDTQDWSAVRGSLGLLVTLISGASAQVLRSIQLLGSHQSDNPIPNRRTIDPRRQVMRLPVLKPDDGFDPDEWERPYLEPVEDFLDLPIPLELSGLLQRAMSLAISLPSESAEDVDRELQRACARAADETGLAISLGRVRKTLACMLQEAGGNIASTMLICGDTLGPSTAPLYYYAPKESDLQALYVKAAWPLIGDESAQVIAATDRRIGCQSLPSLAQMEDLGSTLGRGGHAGQPVPGDLAAIVRMHDSVVDHSIGMLLALVGYRPVDALFRLTVADLDLDGALAVLQDKKVDPAHWARLAVLPPIVIAQLRVYTEHLVALDELTDGKLTSCVRATLAGTRPMFFALSGALEPTELTISTWRQRLPEEWRRLPQNCGRANICTRATEAGAPFDLVLAHLGHLEAASFPFSDIGPTEPVLFAARLAPILEEMAVNTGWRIRRGLRSTRNQPSIWEQLGPVRDWRPTLQAHDAQMQLALRDVRHAQRAALRLERRRGEEIATLVLRQFAPRIATAAENSELQRVDISSIEMIDADGLRAVESEIKTLSQGNVAITIAATRALNKTLRVLSKRKWAGVLPAQWWPLHRPIATPFFPGMMTARTQIEALRMAFGELSRHRQSGAIESPATDFARAALALVLFGFQKSANRVCEILANRHTARRIASLPDTLLVKVSERDVVALSGVAAVALARLRKRHKMDGLPPSMELDRAIACLMPPGAISPGTPTLDWLASLVAVTNRVELSGIARLALDPEMGCVSARMDRQIAFFDGDPPGTAASPDETDSPEPLVEPVPQPRRVGESRPQYLQLVKLVSTANNKTIVLTRSNKEVTPANYENSRGAIATEIDALVKDKETNAVVATLGFWTAHMLRHGTERTPNPAYATIHTYLTSVGDKLIEYTGGTPLSDLDELELTEVCIDIVESKPELARARTARELMAFLDVVSEPFDLEPIDTSELRAYLPAVERSVDAEIILPTECSWAIDLSGATASFETAMRTSSTSSRLSRRRHVALRLIAAASARSGEVLGARHRDLHFIEGRLWLKISPNRNRRIKTPAGRRIVDVTAALDAASGFDVMSWSNAEQQRWPEHERHNAYLFATLDGSRDLGQKSELRGAVAEILAQATTRPRERPHRLRGLGASIRIISLYLPSIETAHDGEVPADVGALDVLTPRDLARIAITLGHANIRTTLLSYFPFPWVLRARSDQWIGRWLNPETAATALSITSAGAIKVRQRRASTSTSSYWLDHAIAPRTLPTAVERPIGVDANAVEHPLTVRDIGCLLGWTERGSSIANAALTIGASARQLEATHLAAREFEAKTGCGLLRGDKSESGKAIARRFGRAAHLYRLWDIADRPEGDAHRKPLDGLVESIFALAAPDARNVLRLSKRDLPVLASLLTAVGHSPHLVEVEHDRRNLFALVDVMLSTSPAVSGTRHLLRVIGAIWIARRQ